METSDAISDLAAALEGRFRGELQTDVFSRQLYASAACIFQETPLAVLYPRDGDDLKTAVAACHSLRIPMLPRGAGSSLTGGSVNSAVVFDLSKYLTDIRWIDDRYIRVEAGAVFQDVQKVAAEKGRMIGPNPSSGKFCTLGGMLANNSGGSRSVKYGNIRNFVRSVDFILADGEGIHAESVSITEMNSSDTRLNKLSRILYDSLNEYADAIREESPGSTKNASGYQVWNVLENNLLHLPQLLCGSEGSLGIFQSAVLETVAIPDTRMVLSLQIEDPEDLGPVLTGLHEMEPDSIEFVDRTFLDLARSFRPEIGHLLPDSCEIVLFAEYSGQNERDLRESVSRLRSGLLNISPTLQLDSAWDESDIEAIYDIRNSATAVLHRIPGPRKPVSIIEDSAVSRQKFPDFLKAARSLLERSGFDFVMFGHAGSANLHIRPLMDLRDPDTLRRAGILAEDFSSLVRSFGGTLSGEHGDGRLRTPYLPKMFPRLMPLFEAIKQVFDPDNLMNPGIIAGPAARRIWTEQLRPGPPGQVSATQDFPGGGSWRSIIESCHGCGTCRSYCPSFIASGDARADGRSKANILRAVLRGDLPDESLTDQRFLDIMDFCLNCGLCLDSCPTGVDIPALAVKGREAARSAIPFTFGEKILQQGKVINELGSMTLPFSNVALQNRGFRIILEKSAGIHRDRTLFKFEKSRVEDSVFRSAGGKNPEKPQVVLWSGCSANYHDSKGEQAHSEQLLAKLGYEVIHPLWRCCNIARISHGNLQGCEDDLQFNIETLLPFAEARIPILFSSASCGYAFRFEYEKFFPGFPGLRTVVAQCQDIHDFIGRHLDDLPANLAFTSLPIDVVIHDPCHLKSQGNTFQPADLLKHIPGLNIRPIQDSCCGMAGTYGMKTEHFDFSMKMGSDLFSEIRSAAPRLVVSGCSTCQLQITQGTSLPVIHPIILLNRSLQFVQ